MSLPTFESLQPLKKALLAEYGHFADKRIKNIDRGSGFIIDDRETKPSMASDGSPYGWFCPMFADVSDPNRVLVTIRGPIPWGKEVQAWAQKSRVTREDFSFGVARGETEKLGELAAALILRGKAPPEKREKSDFFVCPRMASCLRRLEKTLAKHWRG